MNYQEILAYDEQQKQLVENLHQPIEKIEETIEKLQKRIENLKQKKENAKKRFYQKRAKIGICWQNIFCGSIAKELIKRYPDKFNQFKIYGPFGMNAETPVYFYNDDKKEHDIEDIVASLRFMPLRNGVQVWTGEYEKDYKKGLISPSSIYALNCEHYIMEEVTSIEQVEKYLFKNMENRK